MSWGSLHFAAFNGDVKGVKELLKKGADPNAQNEDGWTPLGGVEVVKIFLSVEHIQTSETEKARLRCI